MDSGNLVEINKDKIKHVKQLFNESEDSNNLHYRNANDPGISKPALIAATIFLGAFGMHDFMMERKKAGLMHILLISISPLLSLLGVIFGNTLPFFSSMLSGGFSVIYLPAILALVSWLWGIVETVRYIRKNDGGSLPMKRQSELRLKNVKTITVIAALASAITLVLEIVTLCIFVPYDCTGQYCGWGWFAVFIMCLIGLTPFVLSIVFTIYAYKLRNVVKENGQLMPRLKIGLRIAFGLFCGALVGFIALLSSFFLV